MFRIKKINGVDYTMHHLEDFILEVASYKVKIVFSCHCFTEKLLKKHSPDYLYEHNGEKRAFSHERYTLSLQLKAIIGGLDNISVYHTQTGSFFSTKSLLNQNYVVFFRTYKADNKKFDVIIRVESAYLKPNMNMWAAPVKFRTMIEYTAKGKIIPMGNPVYVKRK